MKKGKMTVSGFLLLALIMPSISNAQNPYRNTYYEPYSRVHKIGDFLVKMVHEVDLLGRVQRMQQNGIQSSRFWLGVSASGAFYTFRDPQSANTQGPFDPAYDPALGLHLFSFQVAALADQKSNSFEMTLLDLGGMNEIGRRTESWKKPGWGYKLFDGAKLIRFKYDNGMELATARSMTVTVFDIEPTFPIFNTKDRAGQMDKKSYLELRGSVAVEGRMQEIPTGNGNPMIFTGYEYDVPAHLMNPDARDFAVLSEKYSAGVEYGTGKEGGFHLKISGMYRWSQQDIHTQGWYQEVAPHPTGNYSGKREYALTELSFSLLKDFKPRAYGYKPPGQIGIRFKVFNYQYDRFTGKGGTQVDLTQFRQGAEVQFIIKR